MITENLSTLKIHKLTQEQYERELKEGRIDPNAIYLTPDDRAEVNVQSDWNQTDETKADYIKNKPTIPEVDQTYSATSTNAQSGVALAGINDKANKAVAHTEDFAASDDGVHGIKITKDGKVKIKNEHEVWTTVINPYKTYTVAIDETDENWQTAVSYKHDAENMTAQSKEWLETDIFKDIRPCVFRDGEVQCYLDPNNYTSQIKNKEPLFYSDNEIALDGRCSYTQIIEAEDALLFDAEGNSLPTGRQNSNWDIGYGVQSGDAWDNDRKENITVCYRGTGYMEYKFDVPFAGEYYWFIKFNSQVSNAVRQQEFSINDGEHQIITFPQKGKQWLYSNTYWEQENSKYVFQFMRQCVTLNQGENSIKVFTPADYWSDTSVMPTIEIDYMALTSIDTPDITSGIDKEVLSPYFLKENKFPITTSGITTGTLENNNDCAAQVLSFKVIENGTSNQEAEHAINLGGNRDGSNILMNKPINDYPYLRVYYNCFKAGTSNSDICAYVYLKNGTITRIWGKNPAINNSGQFSYFDIDLLSGWTGGEMSGQGYTLNDIDFTKPLVGLQIKPWYNQVRNVGEYFNIIGLAFYAEEYYEDIVPSYFNGDVMIEIPKMGYKIFRKDENEVQVSVTRDPDAPDFSYDAFVRTRIYTDPDTGKEKKIVTLNNYLYVGAYLGSVNESQKLDEKGNPLYYNPNPDIPNSSRITTSPTSTVDGITYNNIAIITTDTSDKNRRLRSLSGKPWSRDLPMVLDETEFTARKAAYNNNTDTVKGYSLLSYNAYNLITCLSLLYHKSTDSYYSSSTGYMPSNPLTGVLNNCGLFYDVIGEGYNTEYPNNYFGKFIGIENIINYISGQFIDGVKIDDDMNLLIGADISTNETNWINVGSTGSPVEYVHTRIIMGSNTLGFLPFAGGGSDTTYWNTNSTVSKKPGYLYINIGSNMYSINTYDPYADDNDDGLLDNVPYGYYQIYGTSGRLMYLKEE